MESLSADESFTLRSGLTSAKETFKSTYDYSKQDPNDAKTQKTRDHFKLRQARRVIALTDAALGQPNCGLTLEEYEGMLSETPVYERDEISTAAFYSRFGFALPYEDLASRKIREEQKLMYHGRDFVIPKGDYVYFFSHKIGEDGKPVIDKDNIVIFTLTHSTNGMKGGRSNES